jgi:hypothetical protein
MKTRLICALAASLAMAQFAVPAYAETPEASAQFRAAEAQSFTAEDLQRYGLSSEEAARGVALQEQAYQAGAISQTEWILIGIGVLIILAIA